MGCSEDRDVQNSNFCRLLITPFQILFREMLLIGFGLWTLLFQLSQQMSDDNAFSFHISLTLFHPYEHAI